MTTLVIVILIAIWAAVLIYPLARARTEGSFGDSIGTFRRHLSVLERTGPRMMSAGNRPRVSTAQSAFSGIPPYRSTTTGRARASQGFRPNTPRRPVSPAALARRHRAQRRRRDVLFTLLAGLFGSLLLGLIPGLSMMLYVFAGFLVLLLGYIALLIRLRNLAIEREVKLTFFPRAPSVRAGLGVSAAEQQRAAGTSSTLPAGYGAASDIVLRRPAN